MEKIFLNFRTGDQDMAASFLHRVLASWFGADAVFFSSHSIPAGADFPGELLKHAQQCEVLLALIGPRWLTMPGLGGKPLLANPEDWVRREIATALAAGRRVVPLLLANAPRLTAGDLPVDIAPLARIEYRYLRRRDLAADLQTLQEDLMKLIPGLRLKPRPEPAGNISADVDRNYGGVVAGVVIDQLDAPEGSLSGMLGNVSTRVGDNVGGLATSGWIRRWNRPTGPHRAQGRDGSRQQEAPSGQDTSEEWGNDGAGHPPSPELPA